MSRLAANFLLLVAAVIWGSAFVAQSTAMKDLGPLTFTGLRFLIAAAAVFPFALREGYREGQKSLTQRDWKYFCLVGLAFFFGITLQQAGLVVTSVTNAGLFTGLYVVFTPVVGLLLFRDKPHPVIWPASLIALGGTWLLGGGVDTFNWGDILVIVCAVFWALHITLIGRLGVDSGRPLALSTWQFFFVGILALLPGLYFEEISLSAIRSAGFELLYTSLISGGFAFTLQTISQRWTRAGDAAILLSSEALFAALFGVLLLGERLTLAGIAGCVLIFAAILIVQLVPLFGWRFFRKRIAF